MNDVHEPIEPENCPACGHSMNRHQARHCMDCDRAGVECAALEPGVESLGG